MIRRRFTFTQGFTLIELLIVLVIIGLVSSVAVMYMGGNQLTRELDNQATRLYLLLQTASDNAVINNTDIGFNITREGYSFLTYNEKDERWQKYSDQQLRTHHFPGWLVIDVQREGDPVSLPVASPDTINIGNKKETEPPKLALYSSGESTPFALRLRISGQETPVYIIRSDGVHPITLQRPGKDVPDEQQ